MSVYTDRIPAVEDGEFDSAKGASDTASLSEADGSRHSSGSDASSSSPPRAFNYYDELFGNYEESYEIAMREVGKDKGTDSSKSKQTETGGADRPDNDSVVVVERKRIPSVFEVSDLPATHLYWVMPQKMRDDIARKVVSDKLDAQVEDKRDEFAKQKPSKKAAYKALSQYMIEKEVQKKHIDDLIDIDTSAREVAGLDGEKDEEMRQKLIAKREARNQPHPVRFLSSTFAESAVSTENNMPKDFIATDGSNNEEKIRRVYEPPDCLDTHLYWSLPQKMRDDIAKEVICDKLAAYVVNKMDIFSGQKPSMKAGYEVLHQQLREMQVRKRELFDLIDIDTSDDGECGLDGEKEEELRRKIMEAIQLKKLRFDKYRSG